MYLKTAYKCYKSKYAMYSIKETCKKVVVHNIEKSQNTKTCSKQRPCTIGQMLHDYNPDIVLLFHYSTTTITTTTY